MRNREGNERKESVIKIQLRSNIELFNIKTILKVYMIIQSHDEHKLKNVLEAQYKDSWTSL